jgi:hypothetical protein
MLNADLFEDLLATYPAEKRELARQVYCRFAEGDSTQFFTQLFLVLDIYAHYAERIPQSVIDANRSSTAQWQKLRDEINLLAQTIDRRNVNITNHAEMVDERCQEAVVSCKETITRLEALPKAIGAQLNTQAIVEGIRVQLNQGIQNEIMEPFIKQSQELGSQVVPTLKKIQEASSEAHTLWRHHIWKTAWTGSFLATFTLFALTTIGIYKLFENFSERKAAEQIASVAAVMNYNQDAFRQLAIAQVPVKVLRTQNTNGVMNPRGFVLVIENADGAEMRRGEGHDNGMIFFSGNSSEEVIQGVQAEMDKAAQKLKRVARDSAH